MNFFFWGDYWVHPTFFDDLGEIRGNHLPNINSTWQWSVSKILKGKRSIFGVDRKNDIGCEISSHKHCVLVSKLIYYRLCRGEWNRRFLSIGFLNKNGFQVKLYKIRFSRRRIVKAVIVTALTIMEVFQASFCTTITFPLTLTLAAVAFSFSATWWEMVFNWTSNHPPFSSFLDEEATEDLVLFRVEGVRVGLADITLKKSLKHFLERFQFFFKKYIRAC